MIPSLKASVNPFSGICLFPSLLRNFTLKYSKFEGTHTFFLSNLSQQWLAQKKLSNVGKM